jgi:hypothetical protein
MPLALFVLFTLSAMICGYIPLIAKALFTPQKRVFSQVHQNQEFAHSFAKHRRYIPQRRPMPSLFFHTQ